MYNREGLHMQVLIYNPKAPYNEIAPKVKSGAISWHDAFMKYAVNVRTMTAMPVPSSGTASMTNGRAA